MISHSPDFDQLLAGRERPLGNPLMKQSWQNLLFAHAKIEPGILERRLPEGLTLQTFNGDAWVGFVPFQMKNVRFNDWRSFWPQPNFLETNLRTYVTHPEHGPGVWFFSLDANAFLPCLFARKLFSLPYCYAGMDFIDGDYYGTRADRQRFPKVFERPSRDLRYTAKIQPNGVPQLAEPDTFEFWLLERYRLYSADREGRLLTARVWHEPYQVTEPYVAEFKVESDDPRFADLSFEHFRFCAGVEVQAYAPVHCK